MSFLSRLFGGKRKGESDINAVFERMKILLNDEKFQNNNLTAPQIMELMKKGGGVDTILGASGEFGRSIRNPIPVNGPFGEITYLSRLLTDSGGKVFFHRLGSIFPKGLFAEMEERNNVDVYELISADGDYWDILYLDMYHTRKTRKAPYGYMLQQMTVLLRGTNRYYNHFPQKFNEFLFDDIASTFGYPISDPDAKLVSGFIRPVDHGELRRKADRDIATSGLFAR